MYIFYALYPLIYNIIYLLIDQKISYNIFQNTGITALGLKHYKLKIF